MKLLYCFHCGDVFNLAHKIKSCSCGKTKGHYINNYDAEVNGEGWSIAIGNGSLHEAIQKSSNISNDWRVGLNNEDLYKRHPASILCWARQHTGPSNPHTTINKNL